MYSMFSQRGSELRVLNNFKFKKHRKTKTGQVWRCTHSHCYVTFLTDFDGQEILENPSQNHTHTEETKLNRQYLANSVKRKAEDDNDLRPRKLVRKEVITLPEKVADNLSKADLQNARRSVCRSRRSKYPAMPKCMAEVHKALNHLDLVCKEENFLLVNDLQNHIIVFGTATNLRYLCTRTKILMDGTFEFCTAHFKQLFTIHGVENSNYVPLLFCLLPTKHADTYKILFRHLVRLCSEIDAVFFPTTVVVDFETGIHQAVRMVWPTVNIINCRFHLGQSWYRKIQNLGKKCKYDQISKINNNSFID